MRDQPETLYARRGEGGVAYQVLGSGPIDLVFFAGAQFPVDVIWEDQSCARFLQRLASFSRLVLFDGSSFGSSDHAPVEGRGAIEQWADDALAVLDTIGSHRAAAFGTGETGSAAVVFTATHPERISALVLHNVMARYVQAEDYPFGMPARFLPAIRQRIESQWGLGTLADVLTPSLANDRQFRQTLGRLERLGCGGPQDELALWDVVERLDVRDVLSAVRVPTLVMHRKDNRHIRVEHGHYIAENILGARFVELPGADHFFFVGDTDVLLEEVEEFLTGVRGGVRADRVLATVLFSDIVGSTEQAARRGDRAWRECLDAHDSLVAEAIDRYRGRLVKTTGDGALATFDGPARAIQCAATIRDQTQSLGLTIRAGLHCGEVEVRGEDVGGIGVHIASRVAAQAQAGTIWVTRTVTDLVVGSGIEFDDRGEYELKGVPGSWRLFAVTG